MMPAACTQSIRAAVGSFLCVKGLPLDLHGHVVPAAVVETRVDLVPLIGKW